MLRMNKMEKLKFVKNVAIYVRKSRGETEEDLSKHHRDLVRLCEKNKWSHTTYQEIGTADTIEARPVVMKLLGDVDNGYYDAVVAVHIDRMSRGDGADRALLQKTLLVNDTLLVTLSDVYDMEDEASAVQAELQGIFAKMELNTIKRRFKEGKLRATADGFWVNGKPPFPYSRNSETKRATPDKEKLVVYREMIRLLFSGYTTSDIAWEINKLGVKTNTGGMWSGNSVHRILLDEVHLGKIAINKTKRDKKDRTVRTPLGKDEWIIYENCHESVKTLDEHDKILFLLQRNKKTPTASRSGKSIFSSLVRCKCCGNTLVVQKHKNRKSDTVRACAKKDAFGNRCKNYGGSVEFLQRAVIEALTMKKDEIETQIRDGFMENGELSQIENLLSMKHNEIKTEEKALSKTLRSHELNLYSDDDDENDRIFKERHRAIKEALSVLEEEFEVLSRRMDRAKDTKSEDLLANIEEVVKVLSEPNTDVKMANRAYKTIINCLEWERPDLITEPTVYVNFL